MRRAMQAKLPAKIDIGPVYNVDPQRRKAYSGASLRCCHPLHCICPASDWQLASAMPRPCMHTSL